MFAFAFTLNVIGAGVDPAYFTPKYQDSPNPVTENTAAGPYPQCMKTLSAGCTAAKAKLTTLPYITVEAKVQGDLKKVSAASDSAGQCDRTMHNCTDATGMDAACCDITYDWSNYTNDVTLLAAKGNEATGGGGKACFMHDEVIIKPPPAPRTGVRIQTNSFHQFPAYFPSACLNDADMDAYDAQQSCICKAAVSTLAFCNQTFVC
jgi:hypothetical protein